MPSKAIKKVQRIVNDMADWRFDPERNVYVVEGRDYAPAGVREMVVEDIVGAVKTEMGDITRKVRGGEIMVYSWHMRMKTLIRTLHTFSALAAVGERIDTIPGERQDIEATIQYEQGFLEVFKREVQAAREAIPWRRSATSALNAAAEYAVRAARWVSRAESYADAGLITYERHRWYLMRSLGYSEVRRRLSEAEHCAGCVREAARGWVDIARLVPLGYEECGQWCKCTLDYRSRAEQVAEGGLLWAPR